MKKVLFVFGTRPEAIKMAPLIKELKKYPEKFETKICVTAQHRHMLDQVLQLFEITPDYDLNIMKPDQDLYEVTSSVLMGMRDVLKECKPDIMLVHGDTSTTIAAALSAFYQKIQVGHVEAGLRTHDIYSPWPEEMNRQLTSRIANYNFTPTEQSKINLISEGINPESVYVTGNTVIDALQWVTGKIRNTSESRSQIIKLLKNEGISEQAVDSWTSKERRLVLITAHRRENFGQGFRSISKGIKELSLLYSDVDFVFPMHLNPNVRKAVKDIFISSDSRQISAHNTFFIEPLDYLPFVYLMSLSYLVLTDSGGIQEEAPGLGKPVLVLRNTTERPEALDAGTVKLISTDELVIIREVSRLLDNPDAYLIMANSKNPFGDGKASARICKILQD